MYVFECIIAVVATYTHDKQNVYRSLSCIGLAAPPLEPLLPLPPLCAIASFHVACAQLLLLSHHEVIV